MRLFAYVAVLAALCLAGCAGMQVQTQQTAQQIVFAAEGAEILAIRSATVYKQLPLCDAMRMTLCSRPENVAHIDQAMAAADATIESAKRTVRNPAFGQDVAMTAAAAAREAAAALAGIVAIYNK